MIDAEPTTHLVIGQPLVDDCQTNHRIKLHAVHPLPFATTDKGQSMAKFCAHATGPPGCLAWCIVTPPLTRTDTFGLVMLVAMARVTPVAAYPVKGAVDIVTRATGALDEDLGAAAARALEVDRAEYRCHALRFGWQAIADRMYEHLVPARRPDRSVGRSPGCASAITSFTARSPRWLSERRKSAQNGSASEGPITRPKIPLTHSVLTPTASFAATDTIRPAWRTFRYVASIHTYGHSPSSGRSRNHPTCSSISSHNLKTWFLLIAVMPNDFRNDRWKGYALPSLAPIVGLPSHRAISTPIVLMQRPRMEHVPLNPLNTPPAE